MTEQFRPTTLILKSEKIGITLSDFFDNYYYPDAKIRKKYHRHDLLGFNKHFRDNLGEVPLTELEPLTLDLWVRNYLERGYAPVTINKHIFLMNRLLNMARHWGFINFNSFENRLIRRLPIGNLKQRFLNPSETKRILTECKNDSNIHIYHVAKVLLLTGARVGELRGMLWQHVDLQAFVWDVPISKSGRPRRIYLGEAAVSALKELRATNEHHFLPTRPADVAFMNPRRRCAYNHFHSAWDRCRTRAELKSVRIHDLRHTYASILINKGVSLYEIQRLLGHHHITMTERYAHLLPNTLKNKVDLISDFIE